jgi:signal transduction histidine kinase
MNSLPRSLRVAVLLLAVFLATAAALQWWLRRETTRLQDEAVATRRVQLDQAVGMIQRMHAPWNDALEKELGGLLGGKVSVLAADEAKITGAATPGALAVECDLPGQPGRVARLTFMPLVAQRLAVLHRRVLVVTVIVGLLLLITPVLAALAQRDQPEAATQTPWRKASTEMDGLTHFARISVERGAELAREAGARQRAEEDLHVSRTLLTSSQQERARLGRDLHDNICQTLYAVSLTLESVGRKMTAEPEIERRLAQSIEELRRLNQEVRLFLRELEPEQIQRQSFTEAIGLMLGAGPAGPEVKVIRQLDEAAVALISPQQSAEVVNILREAISNAVRHGRARTITLRAERSDATIALAVQDDGRGFPTDQLRPDGHGLANMQTRATALGGSLRVESAPGKGTRILLLLPVASAP